MDQRQEQGRRSGPRPFVSGRAGARPPLTASVQPRPFPALARTEAPAVAPAAAQDEPRWTVAVYEAGMDEAGPVLDAPAPALAEMPLALESAPAALAAATDEALVHEAAEVLEALARRVRSGEILLPAGNWPRSDAAVVAAVLGALLGDRDF